MLDIFGLAFCVMLISIAVCMHLDNVRARRVSLSKVRVRGTSALESRSHDSAITRAFARIS